MPAHEESLCINFQSILNKYYVLNSNHSALLYPFFVAARIFVAARTSRP
jgi:hypothetical protein